MKGDKPLSDFIRTNGVYQSTAKLNGEMHAGCFMYGTFWTYLLFREGNDHLQFITSGYDFSNIESIKQKINVKDIKLISNSLFFNFKKENWEDGTFSFDGSLVGKDTIHYYGHLRTNFISDEDELLIIGSDNTTDIYRFIEIKENLRLQFEILNLFSQNRFVKVNNGLPSFGQTDIEGLFAFEKLVKNSFIVPSGSHHLDCYDYMRTNEGDKYFEELRIKMMDK